MEDRVKGGRRRLVDIEASAFGRARLQFENARGQINGGSIADVLKRKQETVDHISGLEFTPTHVWMDDASHFHDALLYGQAASRLHRSSSMQTGVTVEDPLAKFKDHELIMALLKRGYAAMKLPADGGPPEVLRGKD